MKKLQFKTNSKQKIADTVTPVGLYLRLRDKYSSTLLLESSDYHSKEESYSFSIYSTRTNVLLLICF